MHRARGLSRTLFAVVGVLLLDACGGGGSATPLQPQSIAFTLPGPVDRVAGDASFSNVASGGGGTGAIAYASDAPSVATVNAMTGTVTIVGAGIAQITATKAADTAYLAASANYQVRVAPKSVAVTAWVGPADSQVSFSALPFPLGFTRSTDLSCDPGSYSTCPDGAQSPTQDTPITDTAATRNQPAGYWLTLGTRSTSGIVVPEQKFAVQRGPGSVVMNGRLWVVTDPAPNEVWSSADGVNWRREVANLGLTPGTDFKITALNGVLWVVSSSTAVNPNDVRSSVDGKTWTFVSGTTSFPPRSDFALAAFNGRLWVSGGWNGAYLNDVWSTADGITWTQATAAATPYGRTQHELIGFGGKLWIVGGFTGAVDSDVWSSPDGATWALETANAAFGGRFDHRMVTDGTTMWLIAGRDAYQSAQRDVWSSQDGRTWTQVTASAEFSVRAKHGAVVWNGQLWVVGGQSAGGSESEVWASTTGLHWMKKSLSTRIPGWSALSMAAFQGKLWVLGAEMQLWSSADGLAWNEEVHAMPTGASSPQLLALPDRLLLIGGWQYAAPSYYREVWQSSDGRTWSKAAGSVPFDAQPSPQIVVAAGKAWAFAGSAADPTVQEIWTTSDGTNWTRVATSPAYSPRSAYTVIWFNGHFWLFGGFTPSGSPTDIWSSPDGIAWTQANTTGLPATDYGPGVALTASMCVYAVVGAFADPHSVWCSSDGLSWSVQSNSPPYGSYATLNGTYFAVGNSATDFTSTDLLWRSADGLAWRLGYQNTMQFP